MSPKLKKILLLAIKVAISTSLLGFLLNKIGLTSVINILSTLNPLYILTAGAIYVLTIYISALRWRMLIPERLKVSLLFDLYIIGSFFNMCLPGSLGGDALKAYYLSKFLKNDLSPTATALTSVFMDRYIGLLALMSIALLALPFAISFYKGTTAVDVLVISIIAILVSSVLVIKLKLGSRFRFIKAIYDCFLHYKHKRKYLLKSYLYSFAIQGVNFTAVYLLAKGLAVDVPLSYLISTLPMIIFISFIPISISGLGLREGAFVFFMTRIGIRPEEAVSLSLAWFISSLAGSLVGLVRYLRFKAVFGREQEK